MQGLQLPPDTSIDLHMHTVFSDGVWSPEALIDHLCQAGFGLAAITDHDRVDTLPTLQELARHKGLPLLVGVEISTKWRDEYIDVLCYGFDPAHTALRDLTEAMRQDGEAVIRGAVEGMARQGHSVPEAVVADILAQPLVRQPHLLVAHCKERQYGGSERAALNLLKECGLRDITTETGKAVEAAHQSGGVCLIAHPARGSGYLVFDPGLLDALRSEMPIDGLEVFYPKHSEAHTAMLRAYAEQHGLLMSAGSDSHAPDKPPVAYPAQSCRKLLERLGVQMIS